MFKLFSFLKSGFKGPRDRASLGTFSSPFSPTHSNTLRANGARDLRDDLVVELVVNRAVELGHGADGADEAVGALVDGVRDGKRRELDLLRLRGGDVAADVLGEALAEELVELARWLGGGEEAALELGGSGDGLKIQWLVVVEALEALPGLRRA